MPQAQLRTEEELLNEIAALPIKNDPSFLKTVEQLAQAVEETLKALRLMPHRYETPRLEQLIPAAVPDAERDLVQDVLRCYCSQIVLPEALGLVRPRNAGDAVLKNTSEFSGDAVIWKQQVYGRQREYIDCAVQRLEEKTKAFVHREASPIRERLAAEGLENLPSLELDGVIATEMLRLKKQLYESLPFHDDPELLYKLSFNAALKARKWDELADQKLAEELKKEQVPLALFEDYMGRKVPLNKKKPETVAEVIEENAKKVKRGFLSHFSRGKHDKKLVNIEGNLKNAYKLIVPGTMQHADELMNARRTDRTLRDFFFYTADGNFYFMEDGKPYWAITREPENLILRHIDEAFPQLTQQQNYRPDPKEMAAVLAAEDTVLIDLSQCLLSGNDDEWRYIGIGTGPERYNQLTAEGRKAAERIFGQGDDFAANMQMLSSANIQETRIYVLNPTYIAQHAPQGVLGRASWLLTFGSLSFCYAYVRDVYLHSRLRGVRRGRR